MAQVNASTLQMCYLILTIILAYLSLYQYISIQNNYTFASIPLTLMIVFVSIIFGRITVYSENLVENYKSDVVYEEDDEEELNDVVPNPTTVTETVRSRVNSVYSANEEQPDAELEGIRNLVQRFNTPAPQADTDLNISQLSEDDDTKAVKETISDLIDQLPYGSN
jgi:hypothetical protein